MKKLLVIFLVLVISFGLNVSSVSATTTEYKLTAGDDGASGDYFGCSVAIDSDNAVIGAYGDDNNGDESGSAYVFVLDGSSWVQQAKLTPDDGAEGDNFGHSVAISGETAVIGATSDDENDDSVGSAYVFIRSGSNWIQQAKLIPDDCIMGGLFGCSVAIDGDTAVIGAYGNDDFTGSVYVFERDEGVWSQQDKIYADDADSGDRFGYSVSISEGIFMVGAPYDDDNGSNSGSVYAFVHSIGIWSQQAKLIPGDDAAGDNFGCSVAIDSDTAVIGAYGDDNNGTDSGSAYVFVHSIGIWDQQAILTPADGAESDRFGWSIAVSEDAVAVGAPLNDDIGGLSGSAYCFARDEGIWSQQASLVRADIAALDFFGQSIAVSGDNALVGAPNDDDNGSDSGSAYVFPLSVNLPPVADAGGLYSGDEGDDITLDASASYDLDDGIILYEWDIDNDGEYDDATGVTATTVFSDDGVYTIGLKVTDSFGAYDINSASITVHDLGPSGEFSWLPEIQNEGAAIAFTDKSVSSPDLIVSWAWDFAGIGSSADQHPGFTFMDDGTYTVTLTVTDDDGSMDTVAHDVTVENLPPEVDAGPDMTVDLGDSISVEALFTDAGTIDTHSATIDWGDDTSGAGILTEPGADPGTVTGDHIYTWPGVYEVTIEVTDNADSSGSDTLMVEVVAVADVMVDTLADIVDDVELPKGKGKSITASLDTAVKVLDDSNPKNDKAAINALEAFINKLEAQRGKKIPADIADELIAMTQEIIAVLRGGT